MRLADELQNVLAWEKDRIGGVSAGLLRGVIRALHEGPTEPSTEHCERVSALANDMRGGPTLTNIYRAWRIVLFGGDILDLLEEATAQLSAEGFDVAKYRVAIAEHREGNHVPR